MRALTTWQPWASLVMTRTPDGGCLKPVENRPRPVPSTLPQWMTCLGCYAEAEPDEVAQDPECPRDCACDNGYTVEPGAGILDSRHVREWVPSSEVEHATLVGSFPFRLGIHAGQQRERVWNAPGAYEALAWATHDEPYEQWMVAATMALMPRGALLGSVLVTGYHHADDCKRLITPPPAKRRRQNLGVRPTFRFCSRWAEPDRYHIEVTDPQLLPEPILMRGYQGWWTLPDEVAEAIAGG